MRLCHTIPCHIHVRTVFGLCWLPLVSLFFNLCFWMLETILVPARVHCHSKPLLWHTSHSMINAFINVCVAKAQHEAMSRAEHFSSLLNLTLPRMIGAQKGGWTDQNRPKVLFCNKNNNWFYTHGRVAVHEQRERGCKGMT